MAVSTRIHSHKLVQYITALLVLLWLAGVISGCFANYGRLKLSKSVTDAFESYQPSENHRYYYSGRENKPSAIIGVHRDYAFESEYWTEVDLTKTAFKGLVGRLYPYEYNSPDGYDILDPKGRKAGVWFSEFRGTTIRLANNNRLIVVSPEPIDTRREPMDAGQN